MTEEQYQEEYNRLQLKLLQVENCLLDGILAQKDNVEKRSLATNSFLEFRQAMSISQMYVEEAPQESNQDA